MRADVYIAKQKQISRSRAADLIKRGLVSIVGFEVLECDSVIYGNPAISIHDEMHIVKVGRGYEKIEFASNYFHISPQGQSCLDIGASTGGFTQFLYDQGAKLVISVDVGTNQMHPRIRSIADNSTLDQGRVGQVQRGVIEIHEQQDIRTFTTKHGIDLVVCDISFISLHTILPSLFRLAPHADWLLLFKPQFEVGKEQNPTGIVKDTSLVLTTLHMYMESVQKYSKDLGIIDDLEISYAESHIKGGDGNTEYWIYILRRKKI